MTDTRTTLAIDDDVIAYARSHAQRERLSPGEVVSRLAHQGHAPTTLAEPKSRYALLPARGEATTSEQVRALMDREDIQLVRHLLDVNVWVALLDESHVFHAQALSFIERRRVQIATCPLVENGVVRALNLPGYSRLGPAGFDVVARKLAEICADLDHVYWPDDVSLRTPGMVNWPRVLGHDQITDLYLLALAVAHDECLVTLDHRVATTTIVGAGDRHLLRLQGCAAQSSVSTGRRVDRRTNESLRADRLRQVIVHAGRETGLAAALRRVGRHRDDAPISASTSTSTRIGFVM